MWPAFIPTRTTSAYEIQFPNSPEAFIAPPHGGRYAHGYEVVRPFLDRSGSHTMSLYPLSPEHCTYRDALERGAALLESQATVAQYRHFTVWPPDHLCAVFMMAWYLADDDASIMRLHEMCDKSDVQKVYVAIWANVAFIRNMWTLEIRLSRDAFNKYLNNYYCFVSALRAQGVHLHTAKHPT